MASIRLEELQAELHAVIDHKNEVFFNIGRLTVQVEELKANVEECKKRVNTQPVPELKKIEKERLKHARKRLKWAKEEIANLTQKGLRLIAEEKRLREEIHWEKYPHLRVS